MSATTKKEKEDLVGVVAHLLGFRNGPGEKLIQNENPTKGQRCGTSNSNLENLILNKNLGTASALWEAGTLVNIASELGLIKNGEQERLKREFQEKGPNRNGAEKNAQLNNGVKRKRDDADSIVKSGDDNTSTNNKAKLAFLPPPKRPASGSCVNGSDSGSLHQLPDKNSTTLPQSQATSKINEIMQSIPGSKKGAPVSNSSSLFSSTKSSSNNTVHVAVSREPSVVTTLDHDEITVNTARSKAISGLNPFRTAYDQLKIEDKAKGIQRSIPRNEQNVHVSGLRRPNRSEPKSAVTEEEKPKFSDNPEVEEIMSHESMSNIDPKMVEAILNEVVQTTSTNWDDIAGLEGVKAIIKEVIIWPMRRPDIFTGLRASPRGILFFGPPGTGKTMFGRVIANQFNSTFFNISASSLTSKWIGDGEKMVRALFAVARLKQPSVIFIDEIDSILTQRSDTEHESSRRLKTEFLIQFDGCATQNEERILVIGVTNRPQELDEAARRRFVKRIYIPLPDIEGRKQLVRNLLQKYSAELSEDEYNEIAKMTEGYSGADMTSLCREAAYGPIREVGHMLDSIDANQVRPMQMKDFKSAQRQVKSSVATSDVTLYEDWDTKFGCHI